jgi:anti-sigma factor RsiW
MTHETIPCPMKSGAEDLLIDYCAQALDQKRKANLERHMEQCAACREAVRAQAAVWASLEAFEAPQVSPGFDEALYRRIEAEQRAPLLARLWAPVAQLLTGRPLMTLAAAAAAVALVMVVREPGPSPAPVVETAEIEKAERALEDIDMLREFQAADEKQDVL